MKVIFTFDRSIKNQHQQNQSTNIAKKKYQYVFTRKIKKEEETFDVKFVPLF